MMQSPRFSSFVLLVFCLGVFSPLGAEPPQLEPSRVQLPRNLAIQQLQTENIRRLTTQLSGLGFKEGEVESDKYVGKDSLGEYEMHVVERRLLKGKTEASVTLVEIKRPGKTERYEVASAGETTYRVQVNGQVQAQAAPRLTASTNIPCLKPLVEGPLANKCSTCTQRLTPCFQQRNIKDAIGCFMRGAQICAQCGHDVLVTVGCFLGGFILIFGGGS